MAGGIARQSCGGQFADLGQPRRRIINQLDEALINQRRQAVDLTARALDTQVQLIRALGGGYADTTTAPTATLTSKATTP